MWNKNAVKNATITMCPIVDLNPVSHNPCHTHTQTHTHTISHMLTEVKSTLLSCCWGANGLSLCITDPTLLLHLLSHLPAPSRLCPSMFHLTHPSLFALFCVCALFLLLVSHNLSICPLLVVLLLTPDLLPLPHGPNSHILMNEKSCCIVLSHPWPCSIMAHLTLSHWCSVDGRAWELEAMKLSYRGCQLWSHKAYKWLKPFNFGLLHHNH